jgi:hypothetical protein
VSYTCEFPGQRLSQLRSSTRECALVSPRCGTSVARRPASRPQHHGAGCRAAPIYNIHSSYRERDGSSRRSQTSYIGSSCGQEWWSGQRAGSKNTVKQGLTVDLFLIRQTEAGNPSCAPGRLMDVQGGTMRNLAFLTGVIALAAGLAACSSPGGSSDLGSGVAATAAPTATVPSSLPPSPTQQPSPSPTTPPPSPTTPPPSPTTAPAPTTPAPAPTTAAPAQAPASTAWCKATASVYNVQKDWNNVYVNSNQPYRSATASADGYSWSYETNGSGYALIYLNGPPPGAEITVTVGGATCTTSD